MKKIFKIFGNTDDKIGIDTNINKLNLKAFLPLLLGLILILWRK